MRFNKTAGVYSYATGGFDCICCCEHCYVVPLCKKCMVQLYSYTPFDDSKRCKRCGKVLVSEIEVCSECRRSDCFKNVDRLYPLHSYNLWKKDLVFKWKKENHRIFSNLFADIMDVMFTKDLTEEIKSYVIVPVPPRPKKLVNKGWDQIEDIAKILSKKYRVSRLLERYSGEEQKKLSKQERLAEKGVAYKLKKNIGQVPQKVLLIDDVVTTGATLEKCAGILKEAGVTTVIAAALFRVD